MRGIHLLFAALLLLVSMPAGAVTISSSQDLGSVPLSAGTGLLGSYYKFSSSNNIGNLSNANQLISTSGRPDRDIHIHSRLFPELL